MDRLMMNGHVWRVALESTDTLQDMAAVSGYTMEKLALEIEGIIEKSIREEDERIEQTYKNERSE